MRRLRLASKCGMRLGTLVTISLWVALVTRDVCSRPADTLNLQLEWAYPISITDMKLVDFDFDGIDEILFGSNSDQFSHKHPIHHSARVPSYPNDLQHPGRVGEELRRILSSGSPRIHMGGEKHVRK